MNIYLDLIKENSILFDEYAKLISSRLTYKGRNEAIDSLGYVEGHHIWPACLCSEEQSRDPENIVYLSAKEHFRAHKLLATMFIDKKRTFQMQNALNEFFRNNPWQKREINEEEYEFLRINASNLSKERWLDIEFRDELSAKHLANWQDPEHILKCKLANKMAWDNEERKLEASKRSKANNHGRHFGTTILNKRDVEIILEHLNTGWQINHIMGKFTQYTRKMIKQIKNNKTWLSVDRNEYTNIEKFGDCKSRLNPIELQEKLRNLTDNLEKSKSKSINNKTRRDLRVIYRIHGKYLEMLQNL